MSAVLMLIRKSRTAAIRLTQKGELAEGTDLAEQVGLAKAAFNARHLQRQRLAAYHEKRASESEGPMHDFHIASAAFLREMAKEESSS